MPRATATTQETPKAADAFAAYVALGPGRSLRKLADELVRQNRYKTATTALRILQDWSVQYQWQDRIAQASSEAAERMLEEALALDAESFLETSRLINERVKWTTPHNIETVIKMRESVRKPAPKGGTSVTVNIEIQQIAEKLAKDLGMDASDLIAEAERIAAGAWGDV